MTSARDDKVIFSMSLQKFFAIARLILIINLVPKDVGILVHLEAQN